MKKSELKQLIKVIVQEAVVARQQTLKESKGLSGFKKTSDSVGHTEKIATEKNLTANSEPKEKAEGKKLPVVKKPSTPSVMKEDVVAMIREELEKHRTDEMARTPASIRDGVAYGIGNKFKVQDTNSPTGWSIKGHPNPELYPDGMPTEAPKGPYVPKGDNPNMGRPKKDAAAPSTIPSTNVTTRVPTTTRTMIPKTKQYQNDEFNSKIDVVINGETIGELDFATIKGSVAGYLSSMLRANDFILKLDPSVTAKLEKLSDLFVDDKLPAGSTLDLALGSNSIELV